MFYELPQFLAEFAAPVNRKLFPSWDLYLREFLSLGYLLLFFAIRLMEVDALWTHFAHLISLAVFYIQIFH